MIQWLKKLFSGPCPLGPRPIDSIKPPGSDESCAEADGIPASYGGTVDDDCATSEKMVEEITPPSKPDIRPEVREKILREIPKRKTRTRRHK